MSELKSCPFCGKQPQVEHYEAFDNDEWWIGCNCECEPCTRSHFTREQAIAAWNTRAERTCKREKHGTKMDGSPKLRCSLCGYGIGDKRWNYCPNCGARVKGDGE